MVLLGVNVKANLGLGILFHHKVPFEGSCCISPHSRFALCERQPPTVRSLRINVHAHGLRVGI